jgi:hypothetical protein
MSMANAVVRRGLISAGLAGALCLPALHAAGDSFVVPGSKAAGEASCVEDTDFMRRNHMEVIKHQRDETVHGGIRSTKHSLAGCIECHASRGDDGAPLPVNDEGQFCGACHAFAAVSLNCFDCHSSIPDTASMSASFTGAEGSLAWHPPVVGTGSRIQVPQPAVGGEANR